MPTSTDVTKLNINELTETQYDAAVLAGTIGANDLSFLTDVNVETQVSIMPAASADELGKVYQFIGTTDANYTHGYFYECVSDGQTPATYSWSNVQVQAGGGGSSYTAGTGIDITGGVISVTAPTLTNRATGQYSLAIGNNSTATASSNAVAINGSLTNANGVVIGASNNQDCIIIGSVLTNSTGRNTIVLNSTNDNITYADLGSGEQSAFYVKTNTTTGAVKLMSADGTIPSDRLVHAINKYSTMPTAASTNEGWIVQFTGTTDSTYTHGHLYECVSDGGNPATYSWTEVSMGGGGSSYTAGTGIDITSGTISTTIPLYMSNVGTSGYNSLGFNTSVYPSKRACIFIGEYSGAGGTAVQVQSAICIGNSTSGSNYSVVIGQNAGASSTAGHNICIGHYAMVGGSQTQYAIQLGSMGTTTSNPDSNTFKVANANGNYEMMDANGNLPADRLASTTGLADGNYRLRLTIASGVPTLSWVAE